MADLKGIRREVEFVYAIEGLKASQLQRRDTLLIGLTFWCGELFPIQYGSVDLKEMLLECEDMLDSLGRSVVAGKHQLRRIRKCRIPTRCPQCHPHGYT